MKRFHPDPGAMIVVGVLGISMSSILVKYSAAPAAVTAAWRPLGSGAAGLWQQPRHRGRSAGGVFHNPGTQHLQLVPEVLFPGFRLCHQALRAGGGICAGGGALRPDPVTNAAGGRRTDPGGCAVVLPDRAEGAMIFMERKWRCEQEAAIGCGSDHKRLH